MQINECINKYYDTWTLVNSQKKEILELIDEILKKNLDEIPIGNVIEEISLEVSKFGLVIEITLEDEIEINTNLINDLNKSIGVTGVLTTYYGSVQLIYNVIEFVQNYLKSEKEKLQFLLWYLERFSSLSKNKTNFLLFKYYRGALKLRLGDIPEANKENLEFVMQYTEEIISDNSENKYSEAHKNIDLDNENYYINIDKSKNILIIKEITEPSNPYFREKVIILFIMSENLLMAIFSLICFFDLNKLLNEALFYISIFFISGVIA